MKNRSFFNWIVFVTAVLLMTFFQIGIIFWYNSGHAIADVVKILTQDWLLLITFIDGGFFTIICIWWLISDLSNNRNKSNLKWIWLGLTIIFGAPIVMFYIFSERKI
jgi:hypothetical protein